VLTHVQAARRVRRIRRPLTVHAVRSYVVEQVEKFCEALEAHDDGSVFSICLSGQGRLMGTLLDALVAAHKASKLCFDRVAIFVSDEFVCDDMLLPLTQHTFFWHRLFKHVNVRRENVYILDGSVEDWAGECGRFEAAIKASGGLDLVVTESGPSGEIARNAPGSSLSSQTRATLLNYDAAVDVAEHLFDGEVDMVPRMCLTVGLQTILQAAEVVLLFAGIHKSVALENCVEHPVSHMWPVSSVQRHCCCMIVCDEAATMELRVGTVRYFEGLQCTANLTAENPPPSFTRRPPWQTRRSADVSCGDGHCEFSSFYERHGN